MEPAEEGTAARVGRALGAGVVFVAATVPFLLLTLLVAAELAPVARLDGNVQAEANEAVRGSPVLLSAARGATELGGAGVRITVAALAAALLLIRGRPRPAAFMVAAVALGAAANPLLKEVVDRARPVLPDPGAHAGGSSFPSGHAMGATVLFGALLLVTLPMLAPRLRPFAGVVAALVIAAVAASRVLLGVHYLTDVVAGCLAGAAWLALAWLVFFRRAPGTGGA